MPHRLFAFSIMLVLCALPVASQVELNESEADPAPARPSPRIGVIDVGAGADQRESNDNARAVLAQTISMTLADAGLQDALEHFAELARVQLDVNWAALELVGIDQDSLVTIALNDISGTTILSHILANISAENFDDDKAGYCLDHGIVTISTRREAKTHTYTRIYDIRALLREPFRPVGMIYSEDAFTDTVAFRGWIRGQRVYPFSDAMLASLYRQQIEAMRTELANVARDASELANTPVEEWEDADLIRAVVEETERVRREAAIGGQGGGGGLFANNEPDEPLTFQRATIEEIETLVLLIQDSVGDPDEWLDEESAIRDMGGELVVKTTEANHRAIEALLNAKLDSEVENQASILRDAQVMAILHDATKLQTAGDIDEVLLIINRALLIDPNHITAIAMHRVVSETLERLAQ